MNDTRSKKKEKCQHIQVFVRVRPINNSEQNNKSTDILEIVNDNEIIIHEHSQDKFSRKFKFNNIFGPSSKQIDVYNIVVSPLLEQVLAGYNCTVFAYGQTGTGKTFTMEGINNYANLHWHSDSSAGMIPRSLSHLFDKLELLEVQEYTIKVSFLELYNEDLFDLLSPSNDSSKIRLYEDVSKKGAIIIHGLEEVTIHNTNEVYKILKKGSEKRQTAATLMNTQSRCRSHAIFSITVHIKENVIDGEEILKTGKLNLVDLAGSENVGKSGAVDRRAREAGNINQSLLTLGRVITALVERAPHIPYRESKLTRLLQESLGGRTKTSIIATISPASINLEETLSTLDYAHRAKNITNRPEINQKLSKREFLKQYTEEIEKLRRDLFATRERNGVYLADDNYKEMQTLISRQTKEIEEKINRIKALEKTMQDKEKIYNELELQNVAQTKELHEVKNKLSNVTTALKSTNHRLKLNAQERDEQKYLIEKHINTEQSLLSQAQSLLGVADTAVTDSYKLHDKIERKSETEKKFEVLGETFKNNVIKGFQNIEKDVSMCGTKLKEFFTSMKNDHETSIKFDGIDMSIHQFGTNVPNQSDTNNLMKSINKFYSDYQNWIRNEVKNTISTIESEHELMSVVFLKLAQNIDNIIENEIIKNLQIITNNVSEKLKQTLTLVNETIDSTCNYKLETYDYVFKNVKIITENIEMLYKKQEFSEKELLFSQMMESVFSQFNNLNKSRKEYYSTVANKCDCVHKICNEANEQITNNSDMNVKMSNKLKEHIRRDIEKIEDNLLLGTKHTEEIVYRTTEQGKDLINDLNSNVNESCNILKQYNGIIECDIKEMQGKMDVDKNIILSLINDAHKVTSNVTENHTKCVNDKRVKTCDIFQEICTKLDNQMMESCVWTDDVVNQIQSTVNKINKFFDEDVQRDIPTGMTPAKKNFSYPRQFTVTSPHERILQRAREAGQFLETAENDYIQEDTSINGEITMKQIANSTTLSEITLVSSSIDNTLFTSSILNNDILSKHTSSCSMNSKIENITQTSDVSSISMQSHIQSEAPNYARDENKENDYGIITHQNGKRLGHISDT
ncbi:PREDICTED: kinesin-like protein Klp61F [Eufriesea mexicana]|uniref:kinesin-like protein Klp61F n=1 Tax=Eufriesea mexicana TaxID=516756 RepID=UPI00083C243B|nr:PREDICTED: kinesin-like protein Klp61F [Eufriesea mexicana]